MPSERIVPLPSSENFWSVGGPGPCGPDSEMYWDWGEEVGCGTDDCKPGCTRCERFLEFGNLVFMSYELHPDGTLTDLPSKNIDTGWGLERVARVVQDVASVYDTDGYQLIMDWVAEQSGVAYGSSEDATKAHRVLADHGRGMTFIVAEGVSPSNEGRGYVLRRIVRRAAQHGLRIGMEPPFLPSLADVVIEQMGAAYPELVQHRAEIHRVLAAEEERFGETLERGMEIFEEAAAKGEITGEDAFTLKATYGFPEELTLELARERGLAVNEEELTRLLAEHQQISRQGGTARYEPRLSGAPRAEFVGYEQTDVRTAITAYADLGEGLFQVKLAESPFYPAGGGQVTDAGWIEKEDGSRADLVEALRLDNDQELVFAGTGFAEGDRVRAVVPWGVRYPTHGEPHRNASPARGAARGARRPRQAGRLGRASRQAPLRLHAPVAADAGRARRGREARQRARLREHAGADLRDAALGGAQARRDDAVRREVRRRRARRRRRRLVGRALRRHARPLDRRDRAVRGSLRELGRRGLAADRGRDRGRGVRAAARAGSRGRFAARRARAARGRTRSVRSRPSRPRSSRRTRRATSCSSR